MVCYQVLVQFIFHHHKSALDSTHIKKRNAQSFLVRYTLPFGSSLKYRCLFKTKKEAVQYASYLHAVYKNRMVSNPTTVFGGQFSLFKGFQLMSTVHIKNIPGFIAYVRKNFTWQISTIRNVIQALGYNTQGGIESLKALF
jgi:hypothetical protein